MGAAVLAKLVGWWWRDPQAQLRALWPDVVRLSADLRQLWWPLVGLFAALGLFGLVHRVVLWREPELLADLVAERERESRPAA